MKNLKMPSLYEYMELEENEETTTQELSSEEFVSMVNELVALDDEEEAKQRLKAIFDEHPYMHEQLGEVLGKDKYKEGIDVFVKHYFPDHKPAPVTPQKEVKPEVLGNKFQRSDDWVTPEEVKVELDKIRAQAKDFDEAKRLLKELFDKYPYMHEELGEVEGKDYYEEVIMDFVKEYYD